MVEDKGKIYNLDRSGISFVCECGLGYIELKFNDEDNRKKAKEQLRKFIEKIKNDEIEIDVD